MENINNTLAKIICSNWFIKLYPLNYINILNKYYNFDDYYGKPNIELENFIFKLHSDYLKQYWLKPLKKLDLGVEDISIEYYLNCSKYHCYTYHGFQINIIVNQNFGKLFKYKYNELLYKDKDFMNNIIGIDLNLKKHDNIVVYSKNEWLIDITNFEIEIISYLLNDKILYNNVNNMYENFIKNYPYEEKHKQYIR